MRSRLVSEVSKDCKSANPQSFDIVCFWVLEVEEEESLNRIFEAAAVFAEESKLWNSDPMKLHSLTRTLMIVIKTETDELRDYAGMQQL